MFVTLCNYSSVTTSRTMTNSVSKWPEGPSLVHYRLSFLTQTKNMEPRSQKKDKGTSWPWGHVVTALGLDCCILDISSNNPNPNFCSIKLSELTEIPRNLQNFNFVNQQREISPNFCKSSKHNYHNCTRDIQTRHDYIIFKQK